jgi:hypothetical protein
LVLYTSQLREEREEHTMDIATLSTLINVLDKELKNNREMIKWAYEKEDDNSVNMWSNIACQTQIIMGKVETMLENEIAHREYTNEVHEEAA